MWGEMVVLGRVNATLSRVMKRYNPGLFSPAFQDVGLIETLPALIPYFHFTLEDVLFLIWSRFFS